MFKGTLCHIPMSMIMHDIIREIKDVQLSLR